MGVLDWLRKKDDRNLEFAKALTVQERQINSGTERLEMERLLGVKDAIIHDKGAEAIYDSEIFLSEVETNDNETVIKPIGPDYAGQARRLFLSPKLGLGNIDKNTAELQILYARRAFRNMQMMTKEHEWHLGIGSRYVAQEMHVVQNILGSVEGKQQRNLLMTTSLTRVEAGEAPKKKGQGVI